MKYVFIIIICLHLNTITSAQQYGSFTDKRDGKVYKTVKIGSQTWMAENLNVDRFRNRDIIPQAKSKDEWDNYIQAQEPAWRYANFSSSNGIKYGKIYNWYAITDTRGLAPAGFHIPMNSEWDTLINFLGGPLKASVKLKSKNGWGINGFKGGTNSSGFNALPGWEADFLSSLNYNQLGDYGVWFSLPSTTVSDSLSEENWIHESKNEGLLIGYDENNENPHYIHASFTLTQQKNEERIIFIGWWRSEGYYVRLIKN